MNATFDQICRLVKKRRVRVTTHGYTRMIKRRILPSDVIAGVLMAEVIEDYPEYYVGPAVLVFQREPNGNVVHVVWGIEKGTQEPAVVVTAYYPDPTEWSADFRSRKP